MFFGVIGFLVGILFTIIGIVFFIRFRKDISSLSPDVLAMIERELADSNAIYLCNRSLCLTPNYLVMLDNKFKVYSYQNIIWMYDFEQRYNGVRTSKGIKISTIDGKTYLIANMSVATQAAKNNYEMIWNYLYQKNPNMRVGYTTDNITYFNEVKKSLKNKYKKNKKVNIAIMNPMYQDVIRLYPNAKE